MKDKAIILSTAAVLLISPPVWAAIPGDFEPDGHVDFNDFAVLAGAWLTEPGESGWNPACDMAFPPDQLIDTRDVGAFSEYWLASEPPDLPPDMVFIPGCTFQMGDTFSEGSADERPVHTVTLDSFYMGKHEITNGQYCDYLNSAKAQGLIAVSGGVVLNAGSGTQYRYCETSPSMQDSQIAFSGSDFSVRTKGGRSMVNDPMVAVCWYGAAAYCNWRSWQEGYEQCYDLSTWNCDFSRHGYRLATEAEWEYAARGRLAGRRFPWGDTISHTDASYESYWAGTRPLYSYDVSPTEGFHPTWNDGIIPYTSPVGSFPANSYGLYDVVGNVWEWCNDWHSDSYYASGPTSNPQGPAIGSRRALRGGSWFSNAKYCRAASRDSLGPDHCYTVIGFRVVLDLN